MSWQLSVKELMSHPVITAERNEVLTVADERMKSGRIRHIVVVDEEGDVAGVVSHRDLFLGGLMRALGYGSRSKEQALDSLSVKDAMTCEPVTIDADAPIADAAQRMLKEKIGCLPVLSDGKLVGVLTESDFVALVARN